MFDSDAYKAGYVAGAMGYPETDNPYPSLTKDSAEWHQGHKDAQHDALTCI